MRMHFAVSALALYTVGSVRITEHEDSTANSTDGSVGGDKTKDFHPETDQAILRRIKSFSFEPGSEGSGLPALNPRSEEGACGYYFAIAEPFRGKQEWYLTGMRVSRIGDMSDCEDVELAKRIKVANLRWMDKDGPKRFVVQQAYAPQDDVLTIRQERKGKYMFRILPPGSNEETETRYQFENDDGELYSGARAYKHHWAAYRGDQKEEKPEVNIDCDFRMCTLERWSDEKEKYRWMGGTEQNTKDGKTAMKRKDMIENDVVVDVSADQDAGLILAFASTMVHKYRAQRTGITGAVLSTLVGDNEI